MRNRPLAVLLLVAGVMASARLAEAQSVTLEQAVQRLQATLATIPHLNEADFLSEESGPRYAAARDFIVERQCASRTANPLLTIAHPAGLSLRAARDAAGPSGAPVGFELPLRVAALSDLPNAYLSNLAALLESKNLPAEVSAMLKEEIPGAYRKLVSRTSRLIQGYDPARCDRGPRQEPRRPRPPYVFIVPTY